MSEKQQIKTPLRALAGPPEFVRIVDADNQEVARLYRGLGWTIARTEQQAMQIIEAVNSFAAMREALRELLAAEIYADGEGLVRVADAGAAADNARAALALAEGERSAIDCPGCGRHYDSDDLSDIRAELARDGHCGEICREEAMKADANPTF